MGLDQYAYVAAKSGQRDELYEGAEFNQDTREFENKTTTKPREIMYWRKHPNLHGWMESLWKRKMHESNQEMPDDREWGSSFNGIELELTFDDIIALEEDIKSGAMAKMNTRGFFFGEPADDFYREQDLEFVKQAKAELFCGLKVFYNSSW